MADPSLTEEPAGLISGPGTPLTSAINAEERVSSGNVWGGVFQVAAALDPNERRWFAAKRIADSSDVLLRVSNSTSSESREKVWTALKDLESPNLHAPIEVSTAAERVEVWKAHGAPTLRAWRADRSAPGLEEIRGLLRDMTNALEKLHGRGLGHFGIRPSNIFVRSAASGPEFFLGGFEATARIASDELIPIPVDLMYAPPEAAGLALHPPGEMLLQWDWWSLGRAIQEFILGQHVLMLVPDQMYTIPPRGRLQMLEDLLFERDVGALRSGAVELMPDLDPSAKLLLHGLLTTAMEGRWGPVEVREWLAGSKPGARYDAPRKQRFFRLEGRGLTPSEAAQVLRGPDHRATMIDQVFGGSEAGTFAQFILHNRSKNNHAEMLEQAVNLTHATSLKEFPAELVREIAASVALTAISGGRFYWRGRPMLQALEAMLQEPSGIEQTRTLLRALAVPATNNLLNLHDSATAARLDAVAAAAGEAEKLMAHCGMSRGAKPSDISEIWRHALDALDKLETSLRQMKEDYECTQNAQLQEIFASTRPTRGMLVLLTWTQLDPKRHGFKTHAEVKVEKLAALSAKGRVAAQYLFWLRMERAMAAGPLLFGGRWIILAGSFAVVLLLAVHVPGPTGIVLGLVPFALLASIRLGVSRWQAHLVRVWAGFTDWTWRDSVTRCRSEARKLATKHGLPADRAGAKNLLGSVNRDLRSLAPPDPVVLVPWPPRHWSAWIASAISWLAVVLIGAGSAWQGVKHPPSWIAHTSAWHEAFKKKPAPSVQKDYKPVDQRMSWPFKVQPDSPFPPLKVRPLGVFTPSEKQAHDALERARQIVAPYRQNTIDSLTAVYIDIDEHRGGLLLFDGKTGNFKTTNAVIIDFVPIARSWLLVDGQFAIFVER